MLRTGECNSDGNRMHSEEERLSTFHNWPLNDSDRSAELARASFYFLGPGDMVRCFRYDRTLRHWAHDDSPTGGHRRHFPACEFESRTDTSYVRRVRASTDSVDGQLLSQLQRLAADEQVTTSQAAYPDMEPEDTRLTTFSNWPTSSSIQPDTLARAGFFYTGHSDNVKCFFCNGSLRNWEPGDDPWQEHAKWFPRCEYLMQSRGQEYINHVQQSFFNTLELASEAQNSTPRNITTGHDVLSGQSASAAAMFSPVVQAVLQMGFEQAPVESLVQSHFLLTGHHYTSVSDLVADVLQAEEEGRQGSDNNTEPVLRQSSSASGMKLQTSLGEKVLVTLSAEEQLKQLQEERTCKVCMDKLVSMVFIPCGHLVVCSDCAASLQHCPICRAVIRGSMRAFMS
ncbi:baculoviral IAP repeat-containing protein 7 [Ictalurus furcatus]|uniref:baculoviral IAP repeat-containing protein 7 n=1 Tax=Ictalurus furcatus TaxID=66913 RepID=UPI00235067A6|nr:baculoviral IAP repeat-containing protein 7 [Ictalurus furcatus]